ncbi:alcohol dehydrogenase [Zavarzinia sp.]|uniref:alcohol dehydrogenase n=1 Tax=Zavarzinia sp. TaxID=2027920 RepID=UPI003BB5C5A9|nr:alcohol dehydrogenase [Zavarzinia sp.]
MKSQKMVDYAAPLCELVAPDPVPEGTEVVVRISRCGVCHSDLHIHEGYFEMGGGNRLDIRAGRKLPFTLGHEIVGQVIAAGPAAEGVSVGDRRVVYPWIGCGSCGVCARGLEHLCPKGRHLGVNVDGGYADTVLVPHPRYLLDYAGIEEDRAGPLACSGLTAYSALKKIPAAGAGDPLLIIGAGGVGLMAIQVAKALYPAAPLVVAEIDPVKGEAARAAGASEIVDPRDKDTLAKLQKTYGGIHAAFDFVGAEATVNLAIRSLRRGGTAVIVGLFGGALTMPIPLFPWNGITVLGSYVGTLPELAELLDLVKAGKVAPIPVTLRPMSEATEALHDLKAGKVLGRTVLTV